LFPAREELSEEDCINKVQLRSKLGYDKAKAVIAERRSKRV